MGASRCTLLLAGLFCGRHLGWGRSGWCVNLRVVVGVAFARFVSLLARVHLTCDVRLVVVKEFDFFFV